MNLEGWQPGEGHDANRLSDIGDLLTGSRVLITTHENPDGDAFGSLLALAGLLRDKAAEVCLYMDQHPDNADFAYLPGFAAIRNSLPADHSQWLSVMVDCHTPDRAGSRFAQWLGDRRYVALDHHVADGDIADSMYIRAQAASATVVIAELARVMAWQIHPETASALYTGLATDTGFFCHTNTNAEVFMLAYQLVRAGARPADIATRLQANITDQRLALTGLALRTLLRGGTQPSWASLRVSLDMLEASGAAEQDTGGLIDQVRNLRGTDVALMIREKPEGGVKVSLRSRPPWDVRQVALRFGGGGHTHAAGCRLDATLDEALHMITEALEEMRHAQ